MENRKHEENLDEKLRYQNAQKRVKEIRGFYAHLISYVAVNIVLIIFNVLYHELGYMKIKVNQFYKFCENILTKKWIYDTIVNKTYSGSGGC